ncbi:MAG: hypothetical protein PHE49_05290 [bacterium]|nr:hypothetical protein [bacterium]
MEFLLLGGMILLMGVLNKIPIFEEANKSLLGLKLPIGIVVIVVGIASFSKGMSFFLPGLMGLLSGMMLIMDLLKLLPSSSESLEKANTALMGWQIPIGIVTILAAIIGMIR